jgi:kynurenine formamidase
VSEKMRVFDLEQPRCERMPIHPAHQQAGYSYLLHRHHEDEYRPNEAGPRTGAAGIIICEEHTGTHIDALCHQSDALTLYGGVPVDRLTQTPRGFTRHGVEEIPPLVASGILLDVEAKGEAEELEPGQVVTSADLEECCERQGTSVEPRSVLLVRTGNARRWDDAECYLGGPGMDTRAAYWVAERRVLAVGADNMAWDAPGYRDPELGCLQPEHLILLAKSGIYIVENLNLEGLAAARVPRFTFVCTPLKLVGATSSPVRPLAIVTGDRGTLLYKEDDNHGGRQRVAEGARLLLARRAAHRGGT